jgi:hypothetical protein
MESGNLIQYFLNGGNHKNLNFEKYSHSRNMKQPEIHTRILPYASFRENPKPPKSYYDNEEYIIQNLYNGYCDRDGFIQQEYEIVKKRKGIDGYDCEMSDLRY